MANYSQVVGALRSVFRTGRTKSMEWRRAQLMAMLKMFDEERDRLCAALEKDLGKCKFEAVVFEVDYCRNDLVNCINNLSEWAKPEKVKKNLINLMDKCYIRREPFGVALIISAWNYPIQISILPLIGAIAAGNCVVLKPSEIAEHTATLLEELIGKYMDNDCIKCINGGVPETTALLNEKWDNIFYTGNSMVGKIIMKAAAEHLTPVTLELGGKSPVFVDKDTDLGAVANRIMWGKCTNAGQTCIAPDYVMCTKETQDALVEKIKVCLEEFYPAGTAKSPDYGRIVNDRHFQRVKKLIDARGSSKLVVGGDCIQEEKYIAPTVMADCSFSDPVMESEIFGPILPIVPVRDVDEAIDHIQSGGAPLSMYIFTNNASVKDKIIEGTQCGNLCVNDTLMQGSIPTLPFGGVGNSGVGAYHGKFTFDAFSHKRGCMERELKMEAVNKMRYPPFSDTKTKRIGWLQKKSLKKNGAMTLLPYFIFGTLFAVIVKLYRKYCY